MLTDIRAVADHFLIALPNINSYTFGNTTNDINKGEVILTAKPYWCELKVS